MAQPNIVNVRIISAADDRKVAGSLNGRKFNVPHDGNFHPIREDLLPALDDSAVQYEIGQPEPAKAPAGAAGGLGGSAAAPKKRVRKSRAKPKPATKPAAKKATKKPAPAKA